MDLPVTRKNEFSWMLFTMHCESGSRDNSGSSPERQLAVGSLLTPVSGKWDGRLETDP